MSLLNFPIELSETNRHLDRIAAALERIAGPQVEPQVGSGRITDMQDYSYMDPDKLAIADTAAREFAIMHNVLPGSQAHIDLTRDFEAKVLESMGPAGVADLPWKLK